MRTAAPIPVPLGMRDRITRLFALALIGTACSAGHATSEDDEAGIDGAGVDADSTDEGPLLDVGGPEGTLGCSGIDFLFVIDNSSSMADKQETLISSFPGFIEAIQATGEGTERYHVGVVTSDAYQHNTNVPNCRRRGALVTSTDGKDSFGRVCDFGGSRRYLTPDDAVDFFFRCIAQVGTDGNPLERPVSAAVEAVQPRMLEEGACNEGFLRDDAILVVVIVTDDPPHEDSLDDTHPEYAEKVSEWHDAVVAAKHGDEQGVVVVGFIPHDNLGCLPAQHESPNLIDFVESFGDRGIVHPVCMSDYSEAFEAVVSTIAATCQAFVPPG